MSTALQRSLKFKVKNYEMDGTLQQFIADTLDLSSRTVAQILSEDGITITHATVCAWRNAMGNGVQS